MSKKILSILLSLIIVLGIFAIIPMSTSALTSGNFEYRVLDDGTAEITKLTTGVTHLLVPETIDGYTVTSIGANAFKGKGFTDAAIPDCVTNIGDSAFYNCFSVTFIVMSDSVKTIGEYAFANTFLLTDMDMPSKLETIGSSAFKSCGIKNYVIPDSVTSIGYGAFEEAKLTSLTLLAGISVIPDSMCKKCSSLTDVTIKGNVTQIGSYAFYQCTSLRSITLPDTLTTIGGTSFFECTSLSSIAIPASVTSIENYAFNHCSGITEVTVADGNTVYDSRNNCNAIILTAENKLIFGFKTTSIPNTVTEIADHAFHWNESPAKVVIPSSVISIGEGAFDYCDLLQEVVIPSSVQSIGENAFSSDDGLTKATIDCGKLGKSSFSSCDNLSEVIFGEHVTEIGPFSFYRCDSLYDVTIPATVTTIGNSAFGYSRNSTVGEIKFTEFTIRGYDGSEAQNYANSNEFDFVSLGAVPADGILGDVDGDEEVGVIDATYIQRYDAGFNIPIAEEDIIARGDIDVDGEVGVIDATYIQRYDAGFNTPYPIGEPI